MYRFIIDYEYRGITAELPVPPEVFTTKYKGKNSVIDLINSGEVNILKSVGLRDISFKVLLPKDESIGVNSSEFKEPIFFLSLFRNIMEDKKPFRLIILRYLPDGKSVFNGDIMLSIEGYTVTENGGEEGDFYVELSLKEFRSVEIKKAELGETAVTEETVREIKETPKEHIVNQGECLWNIAKAEYGKGELYTKIAEINGIGYPYIIQPGQKLRLE